MSEDFSSLMKETLSNLIQKVVSDAVAAVRVELADFCGTVISSRWPKLSLQGSAAGPTATEPELELLIILLHLASDPVDEVAKRGKLVSKTD